MDLLQSGSFFFVEVKNASSTLKTNKQTLLNPSVKETPCFLCGMLILILRANENEFIQLLKTNVCHLILTVEKGKVHSFWNKKLQKGIFYTKCVYIITLKWHFGPNQNDKYISSMVMNDNFILGNEQ